MSLELTDVVYRMTATMPSEEKFVLTSQMRRAANSVLANLAEGYGRESTKEFIYHASVARGSLVELEALTDAAVRVGALRSAREIDDAITPCARNIAATLTSLKRKLPPTR